ncbi:MAG: acetyl-CoA carboxylase biotin carboxylase subunit [Pseudomonadales bacterium]|jgi:3-methylcrotonyl-CoA carboxylase alpha subunit|nr:acetyl-CoA carboxylase biotin carboxylase subunit [Gammaproteobacteria bacterium]MBP6050463.1 acetyl-CoA carboxylase biotin carboxylase subunit [Pseudomonadales bacterium]MBK6583618.1 acetyl-CoA carboxylase biotin carboxylase subunit [Gammaproteobacteria bacterium]MBK7169876.1 acetyl-CoA carboxylase biotin carboxylase subunit [Gammaproteobacteria bacterium]MBK7521956.1 acetyl-CoA carboxylase biotin carboxylase subunit [Gammaproteobacteria bacterium]
MFEKILIANRGEIACRVIRTARRLGIGTVAVYSDADRHALHVMMADEAVHIGAAAPRESYLRGERIVEVALATGARAIHPGYGFLSENAAFARLCADNGLVFIGPPPAAIAAMGSKSAAKRIMEAAAVPLVPGYHGESQDDALLLNEAGRIGYPVLLKAAAGGGGKGMRRVDRAAEFAEALAGARRESDKAFGDSHMLVEKCLIRPRHVEIQVFCDNHGNSVYLFERDCSLQRRHQKVVEEAPAPGLSPQVRAAMGQAAVRAAEAIAYRGAGTVEFLLAAEGEFYFMEMNTRLQVEHPVTELITGQDLVEWQLRVAAGEPLPRQQHELAIHGHALEVRLYAEDPQNDFLPVTGRLAFVQPPLESAHVRVDTGVVQGDEVSIHYDPMIAKLVVWDETRARAVLRLRRALTEYRVGGLTTNIAFLHNLVSVPEFADAQVHTGFIEEHREQIFHRSAAGAAVQLPLAVLYLLLRREQQTAERARQSTDPFSPWHLANGWRSGERRLHRLRIALAGATRQVEIEELGEGPARRFVLQLPERRVMLGGQLRGTELEANIDGHRSRVTVVAHDAVFSLFDAAGVTEFALQSADFGVELDNAGANAFVAPMNGSVVSVLVEPDQRVAKGDALLIMEAMKMEHSIRAPTAGRVTELFYAAGDLVDGGAPLLAFEPEG